MKTMRLAQWLNALTPVLLAAFVVMGRRWW
jgi:hypothetical protein